MTFDSRADSIPRTRIDEADTMRDNSRRRKRRLGFDSLECRRLLSVTPNDTYYPLQWALNNPNGVDIDAPEAWSLNTGSPSVIVAVIGTTGVDMTNPDLADKLWTNPTPNSDARYPNALHGWDFDANSPAITDTNGHDTNVAGIIAAQAANGQGIAGVSWGSPLMVLKAGTLNGEAAAVDFAVAHGAKVINMSVGWGESPLFFQVDPLYQAIQRAMSSGVVVVAAAGNAGVTGSTSSPGQDLGVLTSQSYTVAPASYRLPNMISVAAVDSSGNLSGFSNYGATTVDLAAPGENIETTGLGDGYISWAAGTSFAAPYVSGVVALVMSQHPEFTPQQVVQRVVSTTKPLPGLAGKTISGGMVNAYNSLLAGLPVSPSGLTAKSNGSNEIDLAWTPSSSTFTTGYKIERSLDGVAWTQIAVVSAATTSYQDFGLSGSTRHSYRVVATSTYAGDSAPGNVVAVATAAAPAGSIGIDAGGGASGAYAADTGFVGGSLYSTTAAIDTSAVTDPAPRAVYQTERYGNFTYNVAGLSPGGTYDVRLDFAEIYYNAPGQRIFNVAINGASVLKNFDLVATTGGIDRAVAYTFKATANPSGAIAIAFTSIVDNAKVSGIRVTPSTPSIPTSPVPVDLAQGRPTYSSTVEGPGYAPGLATDGDGTTRWSSGQWMLGTNTGWIYVDLGTTANIGKVVLDWERAYAVDFQIQVSDDARNWTTLKSVTGNSSGGWQDYSGLNGTGRYVRVYCTRMNATSNYSLYDFQVFGTTSAPPTDLAQGKTAASSTTEGPGYSAANAVDGDGTTRWSSGQWMQATGIGWISVDLGSSMNINEVVLDWERAYAVDFQIQVSDDATNWTTLKSVTGNSSGGWQDYSGLNGTGRYVRIYCTRMNATLNYSLYAFNVY
jgi:subtilisin family serine protease